MKSEIYGTFSLPPVDTGKTFQYLRNGQFFGILYGKVFSHLIPQIKGKIWIGFYRAIYPDFRTGKNLKCWGRIYLIKSRESKIRIGDNVRIVSDCLRSAIAIHSRFKIHALGGSIIDIGNDVGLTGVSISARSTGIRIGDGTIIAPNTSLMDTDFHAPWPPQKRMYNLGLDRDRPVLIGRDVWIGMNCVILKGVSIGDNSIIAAGSVVSRDIPSNVLAGGSPARTIRYLT